MKIIEICDQAREWENNSQEGAALQGSQTQMIRDWDGESLGEDNLRARTGWGGTWKTVLWAQVLQAKSNWKL